ncbi:MAG: prenyltransferase/squalene oxidase repeat-containing protein [Planctomycetota bacterium]|nr:prenyltransferase/squalene oxidase repeat-containing protein [Planctomycetota bacterium]
MTTKTTKLKNENTPDVRPDDEAHAIAEEHAVHNKVMATMPGWLVSTTVHMVLLIILALYSLPAVDTDSLRQLVISSDEERQSEELEQFHDEMIEDLKIEISTEVIEVESDATVEDNTEFSPVEETAAAAVSVELSEIGLEKAPKADLMSQVGAFSGNAFSGRGEKARRAMVTNNGGTKGSETAVSNGLLWLSKHQFSDGGWSFNHVQSPGCRGKCRSPGMLGGARAAATGLALLPFLGAGQTHIEGKYQKTVLTGLKFLKRRMRVTRDGGSLSEPGGKMYSHGIASIALCEAYAMTKDKQLLLPAQQAINFICYAQDPVGGGWRYVPQTPGDTSVVGWQVMALKSGAMGYLVVPDRVLKGAYAFLDSVQFEEGARYGYVSADEGSPAVTAVGLLCRMYFGWKQGNPALEQGVGYIGKLGPTRDIYFNYYATQVMRHWGGKPWEKWNAVMRESLVKSQSRVGHETGSWYLSADPHAKQGGRLYCTAMATMILEVYYRHLPIYAKQSTQHEFPID